MKEQIIFKCIVGSKLYGTNNENSDTDIKGVFLPNLNDLILGKAPKHYTFSSGGKYDKNDKDDVDETYYSLQYFLELAAKGDTNAIDLLFAYTNHQQILINTPIWTEVVNNIDKIITKNVNAYLGYCKSQSFKYSVKGEKLNNFKEFEKFCEKYIQNKNYDHDITLYDAMVNEFFNNEFKHEFDHWITEPLVEKQKVQFNKKFANFNFGEHCYIIVASNKEAFLQISDVKFPIKDGIRSSYYKVKKVIGSCGKRSENAAADNGADYKAISHCIRVLFQVEELLKVGSISFPLKEAEFIKSIKYKTTDLSFDGIMDFINEKIEYIEKVLLPNSILRDKADYKWIEQFILKQYKNKN